MHRDHDMTLAALLMLMAVEAAPCSASHFRNVALTIAVLPCSSVIARRKCQTRRQSSPAIRRSGAGLRVPELRAPRT
jgi:hypothetical protein